MPWWVRLAPEEYRRITFGAFPHQASDLVLP
jgi:hypothetical protein